MPKKHIKHKQFEDSNISSIESHKRSGGKLVPPLQTIGAGLDTTLSWIDTGLPDMLWAAVLSGNLERPTYLKLFRQVVIHVRDTLSDYKDFYFTHSVLSLVGEEQLKVFMVPLLEHEEAKKLLSALCLIENLPDRELWLKWFPLDENQHQQAWNVLARAIAGNYYHQSQRATDIRWLKLIYKIVSGGILYPSTMAQRLEEFRLYPDLGDQRTVRPSIRATELMLRGGDSATDRIPFEIPKSLKARFSHEWIEKMWSELLHNTACHLDYEEKQRAEVDASHYMKEVMGTYHKVLESYYETLRTSSVDIKKEAVFGLVLTALNATSTLALSHSHVFAQGRIVLRSIVEAYITLAYLCHKDTPSLWKQFRSYGVGQTKLAFLKNLRDEGVPDFIDLGELENYANEDAWLEHVSIDLSHWANLNLRKMAEDANVKDFYDRYYDWTSGFSHNHWGAIRDTVFMTCMNPLHRFHRMPVTPNTNMPSTLTDAAKICNLLLELLNQHYSPFKTRIKHPVAKSSSPQ